MSGLRNTHRERRPGLLVAAHGFQSPSGMSGLRNAPNLQKIVGLWGNEFQSPSGMSGLRNRLCYGTWRGQPRTVSIPFGDEWVAQRPQHVIGLRTSFTWFQSPSGMSGLRNPHAQIPRSTALTSERSLTLRRFSPAVKQQGA